MGERTRLVMSVDDNFVDQRRIRRTGLARNPPAFLSSIVRTGPCDGVWFVPRFAGSVTTGSQLRLPAGCTRRDAGVCLAVEVGAAIGPGEISRERAALAIGTVAVALDVVRRDIEAGHGVLARSSPTHTPVSVANVAWGSLGPAVDTRLELVVNGRVRQSASLTDQLADPPTLLTQIARCVRLELGDLVLTGTPDGTADDSGHGWLEVGDVLVATITGVGELAMTVVHEAMVP